MKILAPKPLLNCLLLMMMLSITNLYAAKKIIKWVDSDGVTHYGDKPPMPNKTRKSTKLNQYGVAIEETSTGVEKQPTIDENKTSEAQKRHDHALLSTFASVSEIEIARKRNVRIDELTLESLKQKQATLKASAEKNKQSNSSELSRLQNLELQITAKEAEIAEINRRYEQDKLRYLELKKNQ